MISNTPGARKRSAELTALVFNIMRFATHDGPGIRTTVFFKGCPLSCQWCHNPESQHFQPEILLFEERCRHCGECLDQCPAHAAQPNDAACLRCGHCAEICRAEARQLAGRPMGLSQLLAEIEKDVVFFDESSGGVTLSGGEPLAQPGFVAALLDACRERGIHTVLETCGYARPDTFCNVATLADLVFFDLKLMTAAGHRQYTGLSNAVILQNLEDLIALERPVIVRIPLIPGINDTPGEVERFARYLGRFPGVPVELLPYHRTGAAKYARLRRDYMLKDVPSPSADAVSPRPRPAVAGRPQCHCWSTAHDRTSSQAARSAASTPSRASRSNGPPC